MTENMKPATTAKLPKKTLAKVNDPNNPAWTEDMLGAPLLKRGRGSLIYVVLRTAVEQNLTARSSATTRNRVAT
jgi:hypothetical protein